MYLQHTRPRMACRRPVSCTGPVPRLPGAGPDRPKLSCPLPGQTTAGQSPHTQTQVKHPLSCTWPQSNGSQQPRLRPRILSGGVPLYLQGRQMSQGWISTRPEPAGRHHSNQARNMHVTPDLVFVLRKLAKDRAARGLSQNQLCTDQTEAPDRPCLLRFGSSIFLGRGAEMGTVRVAHTEPQCY